MFPCAAGSKFAALACLTGYPPSVAELYVSPIGDFVTRYFFHTTNGKRTTDAEGIDLPNASAAQTTAIKLAGELLKDAPDLLQETTDLKVDVTDSNGCVLFAVLVTVSNRATPQQSAALDGGEVRI